jgi:RNA polymerase sigma-70 factor (ECF subfamily)
VLSHKPQVDSPPERTEEFVRLFVVHQRQVFAFILTLLANRSDAEDVLQETSAVLWRRFDEFQRGTNFAAWACGVARLQVFAYLRQKGSAVAFRHSFVEAVADQALQRGGELDDRYRALEQCLEKLSARDRQLVQQRYGNEQSVVDIAKIVGRPVEGLYKAFRRIRTTLLTCVDRTLATEGSR